MPARTPRPSHLGLPSFHESASSWTDDLPVCKYSGVGFSTNQIYREDGCRQEEHGFEDSSFHFSLDDSTYLYGVFDGYDGIDAAKFAEQRLPAEILLGQLRKDSSDEEVKEVLRQAFVAVEKGFFQSVDDKLAERATLRCELPEGLSDFELYQKNPDLMDKLNALDDQVSPGAQAVVALVFDDKLYVANVGDSRALLCRTDADGVLRVVQLSVDHNADNEDEILRLTQLGLHVDDFRKGTSPRCQTRCIGNYMVKGGYKEDEDLRVAKTEPVTAEPEIHGGIPLDDSCRFLLLMSNGLPSALSEATASEQVNKELAQMVVEQFRVQSTLTGVAQAVVDKIVRIHHDTYMSNSEGGCGRCRRRDDITLLVRNFNFEMPNALSPTGVRFHPVVTTHQHDTVQTESETGSSWGASYNAETMSSTESSSDVLPAGNTLHLDEDGCIEPYVDFSDFYKAVEEARKSGIIGKDSYS